MGLLLAERLDDAAPLPWLGDRQGGGIEGRWLVGMEHDVREASLLPPLPDFVVYERLPVGAC